MRNKVTARKNNCPGRSEDKDTLHCFHTIAIDTSIIFTCLGNSLEDFSQISMCFSCTIFLYQTRAAILHELAISFLKTFPRYNLQLERARGSVNMASESFAPVLAALSTMQSNVERSQKSQAHEYLEKFQKSVGYLRM